MAVVAACTPAPATKPSVVAVTTAAAAEDSSKLPPSVHRDPASSFACGDERCRVGVESCCQSSDEGHCVENAPPDPPDTPQLWASQIERCEAVPGEVALSEIARCRSSAHCPGGELCCNELLYGGAGAVMCKAAEAGQLACSYGEACTDDLPCEAPGTRCVQGLCRKSATVECGSVACDLSTHTCINPNPDMPEAPTCEANDQVAAWRSEGRPIFSVGCARHSDCQSGELCRIALGSSFCQRADDGMSGVMCETTADCPKDSCAWLKRTVVCNVKGTWHGVCDCI